jgi:chromosome segregation ATPase
MYRFNTTDNNLSDLVALGVDIRDDDNTLNRSYGSAVSAASSSAASASSSKAVLAALRALQDKIRRLEVERTQAIDETTQLRHQLKNQEIEAEHIKQREMLNSQKSLQESRSAYDRLLGDKAELEVRVSKLEERNRLGQQTADELQSKIKSLEEEKQNGLLKVKSLESQQSQLEAQIQHAQSKEKDLANTMVWETKRHEDEMNSLTKKLKSLQDELSLAVQEKQTSDSKQVELDQLVSQLLGVNEALVSQLSGKGSTNTRPTSAPTLKPKKKKPVKGLVPRVAGVTTVALEAARTIKYDDRRQSQLIPVRTDDLEHLKNLHKMYANIASSMTDKKKKVTDDYKPTKAKKPMTRLGKKKSELKTKGSSSSSVTTSKTNGIPSTTLNHKVRIPTPSASFDYLMQDDSDDNDDEDYEEESNRPVSAPVVSNHYSTRSTKQSTAPANDELQEIISSLEDEFDSLNSQYRRLLSSVQTTSSDMESSQAEELVSVIQKLHKKGEILRSLKSPKK